MPGSIGNVQRKTIKDNLMKDENYIEHEVKLRIHEEKFNAMQNKFNFLIGTGVSSVVVPLILHIIKVVWN